LEEKAESSCYLQATRYLNRIPTGRYRYRYLILRRQLTPPIYIIGIIFMAPASEQDSPWAMTSADTGIYIQYSSSISKLRTVVPGIYRISSMDQQECAAAERVR
jgi:hypothetical protein